MELFPWLSQGCLWNWFFSGACISFSWFVSLQQRFETMDQCYSSVTAQAFIKQTAEHTYTPERWGQADPEEVASTCLSSSYLCFLSPSPESDWCCPMQSGACTGHPSGRWCVFFPTGGSHSGPWIFPLFSLSQAFSFLCLPFSCQFLTTILDSPFLTLTTEQLQSASVDRINGNTTLRWKQTHRKFFFLIILPRCLSF